MAEFEGTTIAHYQITAKLGQGGMGEVYRATDTKLDREVAIKVLPSAFAQDKERLARFELEAKVLAQLSHSNIASVHGFDQHEGTAFLVMELAEGEDLSQRLKRGPLPVDEAIEVVRQVAEGLEAAHAKGIIHRDLKPANVRITTDGRVKVLDFGLAKPLEQDTSTANQHCDEDSPTLTQAFTMPGAILGTAAYMSPEQAKGKNLDSRTDVWSFGCVLYECLTGESLFRGETATDSIAAILHRQPDWSLLPEDLPPSVRFLLRRCLAKEGDRRLSEIRQARLELEDASSDPLIDSSMRGLPAGSRTERTGDKLKFGFGVIATAIVVTAVATAGLMSSRAVRSKEPESSAVSRPSKVHLDLAEIVHHHTRTRTLISPDGQGILYQWGGTERDDVTQDRIAGFYLKHASELVAKKLPVNIWAPKPFWSPDGQEVVYFNAEQLLKINISGEKPIPITPLPSGWPGNPFTQKGGVWLPDGSVYFVSGDTGQSSGLWLVNASGGSPRRVVEAQDSKYSFHNPSPLPDGRGFLFLVATERALRIGQSYGKTSEIRVYADESSKTVFQLPGESIASVVCDPRGYLIYDRVTNQPGLWAVPFSLEQLRVTGEPFFVADGTDPSLSDDGALLYLDGTQIHNPPAHELVWLTGNRQFETIGNMPRHPMGDVRLSEDETQALVGVRDQSGKLSSIWWQDLKRPGIERRLTNPPEGTLDLLPTWDPDGQHFYFRRCFGVFDYVLAGSLMRGAILRHRLDGRGQPEEVVADSIGQSSVSSDGQVLVYSAPSANDSDRSEIAYLNLSLPDAAPTVLPLGPSMVMNPSISPDGQWLAYLRADSGRAHLYVTDFPSCQRSVQATSNGIARCFWSKPGSPLRLYGLYSNGSTLLEIEVTPPGAGSDFVFSDRRVIYNVNDSNLEHFWTGDVSQDGDRFLVPRQVGYEIDENRRVVLVSDWLDDFKDDLSADP